MNELRPPPSGGRRPALEALPDEHAQPARAAGPEQAGARLGLGGFNLTALRLEVRRLLRNRRTVIITMVFPVIFFLLFGLNKAYALQPGLATATRPRSS